MRPRTGTLPPPHSPTVMDPHYTAPGADITDHVEPGI
jgi:hypothetical protein